MNTYGKVAIVVALALVVGAVLLKRQDRSDSLSEAASGPQAAPGAAGAATPDDAVKGPGANPLEAAAAGNVSASLEQNKQLPRLVDLGASKCIPCKLMAPILEELKEEYKGRMEVVFIDVWENRTAGSQYGIRSIPTQIFYDASGKERFRHEGFYSKQDILAKCEELGFELEAK